MQDAYLSCYNFFSFSAAGLTFYTDAYMGSVISPPINFDVKKANDGQIMQVHIF